MATHEIVAATAHQINGQAPGNCSLDRRVAIGVKNGGLEGTDAWVILDFAGGAAQVAEVRHCGPLVDADATLDVDIVMIAEAGAWLDIGGGGLEAAVLAADNHAVFVTGKLAYFIRHVRSSVDLMVLFGSLFRHHSEQLA